MSSCVFCGILEGTTRGHFVCREPLVSAILTTGPVTPGHLMVIPNRHAEGLADLTDEENAAVFSLARRLAGVLRQSGLRCEGVNYFVADGEAAFQEVFHFHLHVFPRFKGDTFKLVADWDQKPSRDELDSIAEQLRGAMTSAEHV
ncbi:HIT family protein [Consotaella aegiceratis]|uniref:HIT family protein n=1 Tax=Consotaella aegiceratis TaxID=3097961 RepID=UPI002F415886